MRKWPIWVLPCLVFVCGCQTGVRPAVPMTDMPCPSPNPCDDPDTDALLRLDPGHGRPVAIAEYQPLKPGCPTTLQVHAWLRPIGFPAARPDEFEQDWSDWVCEEPEAPLLRAAIDGPAQQP